MRKAGRPGRGRASRFDALLSEGGLTNDGLANEVERIVVEHPELLADLMEALDSPDRVVRGHAADALEKVARLRTPDVATWLPEIAWAAQHDDVPMVRWHLAMVLGHLSDITAARPAARRVLLKLLADPSPFVRSWAITSLCLIARSQPPPSGAILSKVVPLTRDPSPAVAKRAQIAVRLLTHPEMAIPNTWIKRAERRAA